MCGGLESNYEKAIKELDKNLADTNYDLKQQVKKNEILHKLLKQKDEDVKKDEESKESETNKVDEGSRELTSFSCDICSFSGNSKSALTKHKKNKHREKKQVDSSTTNLQKSHDVKNDDFANKINDFLQSANYLNKLPSNTPVINVT